MKAALKIRLTCLTLTLLAALVVMPNFGCAANVKSASTQCTYALSVEQYENIARSRLAQFKDARQFPGATLAFALDDNRNGAVAVGVADKLTNAPMRPDDRMLSGSIGKTYVAAVALQLVEEGRLDLDSKISSWLGQENWFPRLPNAQDLTLRMLMNHTSGVPEHVFEPAFLDAVRENTEKTWRPAELVSYILDKAPLFPAGSEWFYADTNYILVGIIIERVAGRGYYDLLRRRILKPYDLNDTIPADQRVLPGLVNGYSRPGNPLLVPENAAVDGRCYFHPQMEWTGGGLLNTSRALARWARILYAGDVIKTDSKKQMLQGVTGNERLGPDHQYGLGVILRNSSSGPVYGHSGWFPGYISMMAYYPDLDLALAVQFNYDNVTPSSDIEALLDSVAADLAQTRQIEQ